MKRIACILLASSCASTGPRPPALRDPGACTLASVAAASACPRGEPPSEACIAATAKAVEACQPRTSPPC